jgi:hypothetical protein
MRKERPLERERKLDATTIRLERERALQCPGRGGIRLEREEAVKEIRGIMPRERKGNIMCV